MYCSQLNTRGVFGRYPREWIISHRCSWMEVYVFCCNAQTKSHSDPLRYACYLYSINCPTIICLPNMLLFILWRDTTSQLWTPVQFPLHFYYYLLSLARFTLLALLSSFYHSICSILCLQQTGEIDNLIVSWEQSSWLCCVQVPRCCWCKAKPWTRRLINCLELSQS
jgi:hypothetical protein